MKRPGLLQKPKNEKAPTVQTDKAASTLLSNKRQVPTRGLLHELHRYSYSPINGRG